MSTGIPRFLRRWLLLNWPLLDLRFQEKPLWGFFIVVNVQETPLLTQRQINVWLKFAHEFWKSVLWSEKIKHEMFGHMNAQRERSLTWWWQYNAVRLFHCFRHRRHDLGAWDHEERRLCWHVMCCQTSFRSPLNLSLRTPKSRSLSPEPRAKVSILLGICGKSSRLMFLPKKTKQKKTPHNLDELEQFSVGYNRSRHMC